MALEDFEGIQNPMQKKPKVTGLREDIVSASEFCSLRRRIFGSQAICRNAGCRLAPDRQDYESKGGDTALLRAHRHSEAYQKRAMECLRSPA